MKIVEGRGLVEQSSDVVRHQLPGIEANAQLIGRLFEASKSIIHVALASGPIVRSSGKKHRKAYTKRVAAVLDPLN
jgi:hypothetical protein